MRTHPSVFRLLLVTVALIILQSFFSGSIKAQYLLNSDSAYKAGAANSGRIWGYAFGDAYYKAHSDSFNRGGSNQYSGIPQGRNAFQFRRIYLGYDFNISKNSPLSCYWQQKIIFLHTMLHLLPQLQVEMNFQTAS